MYAQVVLGLPVEGPFDYIVPFEFSRTIKVGMRVEVNFRFKKTVAYVVKLSRHSKIKKIKPIIRLLDNAAVLDDYMLSLTHALSEYYCCSWGEAIETALPQKLRKTKLLGELRYRQLPSRARKTSVFEAVTLLQDLTIRTRWDIYVSLIKQTLENNLTSLVIVPDINSLFLAKELILSKINCSFGLLYRGQPDELGEWVKIKEGSCQVVIGSRSGIFAPLDNLGLMIIDEEHSSVYKQEQTPHYHAREVAFMRAGIQNARLILSSAAPSLESFYLTRKNHLKYNFIVNEKNLPTIKTVRNMFGKNNKNTALSKYLQDSILSALMEKRKVLLFLNRTGFAVAASCTTCRSQLKCPRCSVNLVYHYKENSLRCHYCNFKTDAPQICPACNSGYIKYTGFGTEKIESEVFRIFPQARIRQLETEKHIDSNDADIWIATQSIMKEKGIQFGLVGVLGIDNALNRVDFRASEKTFSLLVGLLGLTEKEIIIQTNLPGHHCFVSLEKKNISLFYEEELKQRKQLHFPPYKHFGLVKLRGKKEERVQESAEKLFTELKESDKNNLVEIISLSPGQPSKLRGNFYWQILVSSTQAVTISKFLKTHLKKVSHSGIIVTVDIDPL